MRRAAIHKLATAAYEMELDVMNGIIHRNSDGQWMVGDYELNRWLEKHSDEEVVLVLGSLADERDVQVRTCRTCGRDYMELECPHCRANRIRLRGHA